MSNLVHIAWPYRLSVKGEVQVKVLLRAVVAVGALVGSLPVVAQEKPQVKGLEQSQELLRKYEETFKPGVPTSSAVAAAFARAKQAKTIEAWSEAARAANTYANVLDVMWQHYRNVLDRHEQLLRRAPSAADLFGKQMMAQAEAADELGKARNDYVSKRNLAYLEMAKLHLVSGNKAQALSLAITVTELSGDAMNEEAVGLIKQIVEYKK